jgi:ubiquinone/menaquinone biosynthesis C-methylase UbiE
MSDPLREWNDNASYWTRHRDTIRTMFAPVTRALVEDAHIIPGQDVLDIAAGAGEPSLTIAEIVGPAGTVTCTDAVAGMVASAEAEARKRGLTNVQFQQCTADALPFSDSSFNAVVSRMGAMFFPDPLAALREMLRVTKPGGSIALVVWYKSELNPFTNVASQVVSRHLEMTPFDPDAPGAFRFAELGKLAKILTAAGADDVTERLLEFDIVAPISREEYWALRSETSGTLREKLETLSAEKRKQIAAEAIDAVSEFFPHGQMKFPAKMLIVSGRKS